ncbi:MAG: prolyl oligopeptidase family serine peptidase, partial [Candidatus Poribacteria bacterium]
QPDRGPTPTVTVERRFEHDGLSIEELSWQLPYGPLTRAYFLKPADAAGPLPGIVGLHDHGGRKYFGRRKITRLHDEQHPLMRDHQRDYYGGAPWANEIAKRGYGVLVHDTFTFASRRVLLADVPEHRRARHTDDAPEEQRNVEAYHRWAGEHEDTMSKALFCAGTTWPGVFLSDDRAALDVLCDRDDVDPDRVGCGGLSGGGLRTVFLGGADDRIKAAVCVGMMTTWRDYMLNRAYTHTWMCYVPLLPKYMDYPEILGMRLPLPTLVQNNIEDQLFTMPEMDQADAMLRQAYEKAGAGDRYRATFYPGPHKFDLDMQDEAFNWFDTWLKDA